MTAPARLLGVRLQGFKSFAERTVVEFGPGISAVVGPNGSGKSNLADALRWALGEQGRSLRIRKSEDVIWAGSERRSALGMADVTLVLDNSDALLPVDFSVLELGRRLYRSGENDYLLNRQRVRLRDLVDLLDAANLADNAFLFIGQGMVDQALALRPEERRPLFEEVAGVRRPERRRRKAEEQLAESEANLARVEDILAELRPQARRLAAQAEQQATRASAGEELAAALVAAGHARWHAAATRLAEAVAGRVRAGREADEAMRDLEAAEERAAAIARDLASRVAVEEARRTTHEAARDRVSGLQLREVRLAADLESLERDRRRLSDVRSTAEAAIDEHRRALSSGVPPRYVELEAAVTEADRALSDALAELATLRGETYHRDAEAAALRRAAAARQSEVDTARRRLSDVERRAAEERVRLAAAVAERDRAQAVRRDAGDEVVRAVERERVAAEAVEVARAELGRAEDERRRAQEGLDEVTAVRGALAARIAAIEARLAEAEGSTIADAAAGRVGARRVDDGLAVDADLRAAVEAALGDAAQAWLVERERVAALASERGTVVVSEAVPAAPDAGAPRDRRFMDLVADVGGGALRDAIRRDPRGAVAAVLARSVVVPDLPAGLAVQSALPPGWQAVARDGSAVVTSLVVRLGRPHGLLERRAELDRLASEASSADRTAAERTASAAACHRRAEAARIALEERRREEREAAAARRQAEAEEAIAVRSLDGAVRGTAWHEAQSARLDDEARLARDAVEELERGALAGGGARSVEIDADAAAEWESRVAQLRDRRDRLAERAAAADAARRDVETRRGRAEAALALAQSQLVEADRDLLELAGRRARTESERDEVAAELAAGRAAEAAARVALDELRAADAAGRSRLADAERAAAAARESLRDADERLRAADRAELEARLALDSLREHLLVELAGLAELGLSVLARTAGQPRPGAPAVPAHADDAGSLEGALDVAAAVWATVPPAADPPSAARLAQLRRRYHELGATNPYAVEEYARIRERLDSLETQERDLRTAIARTRELIDDLNRMIAEQFSTTFRALETAFDRMFGLLFGGGHARLALTDPNDLSTTGIEIVARPPGKKAQPLAMLSGGERALTAVALLFAMLEVRPVPFCVLDEVDAALDEANIGRFTDALRALADRTQFIVITHNRGTIETADALYGVTAGDDSVSRVISLRLEEARVMADGRGDLEPAVVG